MLPLEYPDRIQIAFDDHRLVANAGLLLPVTLAQHLGLRELVDNHVDLGAAPGRANTGDKMMTLVASALAGGDCIDDADVLRTGGTASAIGCVVKAPSILGTFLRSFRWGHVRQLDRVSRELLARAWAAGAGPGDGPLTIDLDSTICETSPLTRVVTRRLARREVRTWCGPRRRTLVPVGSPVVPPDTWRRATPAVVQEVPAKVGLDLANWNWKVVRRFVQERFEVSLSRSSCLNYLHRLGFVLKRPKKRLLKADAAQRETFVAKYAALVDEAQQVGAKVFFVDEAHFRADADLRGKWVLKGEPALVDSTSPRWGEKASYYSAVCLEPARWNGWNWRATAALQPPPLSCGNCGSSTRDR